MLQLVIYTSNATKVLGEMFFRILAAVSIIDGTLSILTIIFYKLYMHKHPEIQDSLQGNLQGQANPKKRLSIWVWILIIYLALQIIFPLIFYVFGSLSKLF